jgi:quinol monooxygenase YgiN
MSASSGSVSVHVKLTIKPSCTESFLKALKPTLDATVAEPLNTFFELYRLEKEPGVFRLVENWNATADYMMNVSSCRLPAFFALA